jgi:DNA-binding NarL/FixJ family response regulator
MIEVGIIENNKVLLKSLADYINIQENMKCKVMIDSLDSFFLIKDHRHVDVLLLDVEMGENINSLDYLPRIIELHQKKPALLIITGHNSSSYLKAALLNGAKGIFIKSSGLEKLIDAIQTIYNGEYYISPSAAVHLPDLLKNQATNDIEKESSSDDQGLPLESYHLSERELQIGHLLAEGYSYLEISEKNYISINTVRYYVKSLYSKLNIKNKIQLSNIFQSKA